MRELISNSSDALEKLRQRQLVGEPVEQPDLPLVIDIYTDEKQNALIIQVCSLLVGLMDQGHGYRYDGGRVDYQSGPYWALWIS